MNSRWRAIAPLAIGTTILFAACEDDTQEPAAVDPCTVSPCSTEAVISQLQDVYTAMDPDRFAALLHPDFLFLLPPDPLNPGQPTDWGRDEEARIHQRMFRPEQFVSTAEPIPQEIWPDAIDVQLTTTGAFVERPEYYASPTNPGGLDSTQVIAWGCEYDHRVLLETLGEIDYLVIGRSDFVVLEDRTQTSSEPGAFLLYRWQDLGDEASARSAERLWSALKGLCGIL